MAEMDIIGYFRSASLLTIAIRGIGYGLVLASFIAFFVSLTNKKIVKRLLDREALSRDTAANAEDIAAAQANGLAPAEIRYVKKGSPVGWIVGMVLLAAATEGAVLALPWILSLFK